MVRSRLPALLGVLWHRPLVPRGTSGGLMITVFTSLALASALSFTAAAHSKSNTANPRPLARALATAMDSPTLAPSPAATFQNGSRDSVTNGAIIGAVAGALLGAVGGVTGCGYGEILDTSGEEADCTGPALVGAIIGAGLGSLIGAGVDAMFERAPHLPPGASGRRTGVRVRWRF
jgi:hypothetical protein